eukprot:551108-Rhodomonas_salina.1
MRRRATHTRPILVPPYADFRGLHTSPSQSNARAPHRMCQEHVFLRLISEGVPNRGHPEIKYKKTQKYVHAIVLPDLGEPRLARRLEPLQMRLRARLEAKMTLLEHLSLRMLPTLAQEHQPETLPPEQRQSLSLLQLVFEVEIAVVGSMPARFDPRHPLLVVKRAEGGSALV